MSYGPSAALQAAVYQHLLADAAVAALVGSAVYDALPAGALPQTYVTLGPEEARDRSDITANGALIRFTVTVTTSAAGFGTAKTVAAAVSDALQDASLTLSRGLLTGLWFERASARRSGTGGSLRSVELRFRARVEDA